MSMVYVGEGHGLGQSSTAIEWLVDAGLVYKITKVSKPELPLKFYEDLSAFKLYLCDCGLMGAMLIRLPRGTFG